MWLNSAISGTLDLTSPFIILSVLGAALCMYVMQKTWHDEVARLDPPSLRWLRRSAMTLLALCLCWAVLYLLKTETKPYPPLVALIAVIDLLFAVRAVTLVWRSMPGRTLQCRAHRIISLPPSARIR